MAPDSADAGRARVERVRDAAGGGAADGGGGMRAVIICMTTGCNGRMWRVNGYVNMYQCERCRTFHVVNAP